MYTASSCLFGVYFYPSSSLNHLVSWSYTVYMNNTWGIIQMNWKGGSMNSSPSNSPVLKFTILLVLKHNQDQVLDVWKLYAIVKFYWFVILYNFYLWILKFMTKILPCRPFLRIPLKYLLSLKVDMTIPSWNLMINWHNLSWTFGCLQHDWVIIHDISPQLKHC